MGKIPKIIHYCWFGRKEKPKKVLERIASWRKYCPDYKIVEWNEDNFDVSACRYAKEAHDAKRWAFVADYVRCVVVNRYGGVYFDTDVELIKPINNLLEYDAFFASEDGKYINTGIGFGSKAGNPLLSKIIAEYEGVDFYDADGRPDILPCPIRNTRTIRSVYPDVDFSKATEIDNMIFLSKEYFCPLDYETKKMNITSNTYGIHWFSESWKKPSEKIKYNIKKMLKKVAGRK